MFLEFFYSVESMSVFLFVMYRSRGCDTDGIKEKLRGFGKELERKEVEVFGFLIFRGEDMFNN